MPGRLPSDYKEEFDEHLFEKIVNHLKSEGEKGFGISLFGLGRRLGVSPRRILEVAESRRGKWINGTFEVMRTPRGIYVVWAKVGEDPILCLHQDEVAVVPIQQNERKVTCPSCGATYIIEKWLCECGGPLREEGKNLYCDKCGAVYLDCDGVFKRVFPTPEEIGDFLFSRLGLRSPRRDFISILNQTTGKDRPPLPCEVIKNIRNIVSEFLGPNPIRVE
ncbi:MAG: hypothetical protein ACE5Z5_12515 [Candidatus Bathyarchaeia archaeon]